MTTTSAEVKDIVVELCTKESFDELLEKYETDSFGDFKNDAVSAVENNKAYLVRAVWVTGEGEQKFAVLAFRFSLGVGVVSFVEKGAKTIEDAKKAKIAEQVSRFGCEQSLRAGQSDCFVLLCDPALAYYSEQKEHKTIIRYQLYRIEIMEKGGGVTQESMYERHHLADVYSSVDKHTQASKYYASILPFIKKKYEENPDEDSREDLLNILNTLGISYEKGCDLTDAEVVYRQVISIFPDYKKAYLELITFYEDRMEFLKAANDIRALMVPPSVGKVSELEFLSNESKHVWKIRNRRSKKIHRIDFASPDIVPVVACCKPALTNTQPATNTTTTNTTNTTTTPTTTPTTASTTANKSNKKKKNKKNKKKPPTAANVNTTTTDNKPTETTTTTATTTV